MKTKAVKLMRNLRDKMSKDIREMSWEEEQKYLRKHIKTFEFITKESTNKSLQPTAPRDF